jgi:hypothetical protein
MDKSLNALQQHFSQGLLLPPEAVNWLIDLFQALQVFDDFADGDPVERKDLNLLIWNTLVGMQQNPFFIANSYCLSSIVGVNILKWQASDTVERAGNADAKSYTWRAGYYDIVLAVVQLCHGPVFAADNAHIVLGLYGETYDDYMKEFKNA